MLAEIETVWYALHYVKRCVVLHIILSKCIEMSFTESTTALAYHTPNKRLQAEVE